MISPQKTLRGLGHKSESRGDMSNLSEVRRSIIRQITEVDKNGKEKKPFNPAPDGPKDINPHEVHGYFMKMADWHEKEARKHETIGSFKPLFSRDRRHHDRRTQFHLQLHGAFAQKAVDALNFQREQSSMAPSQMRESLVAMMFEMKSLNESGVVYATSTSRTVQ